MYFKPDMQDNVPGLLKSLLCGCVYVYTSEATYN